MIFSHDWLAEYLETPPSPREADRILTDVGLAVESVREIDGDTLLDVEVTPNRPDCMCHLGLAREIAVAQGDAPRHPTAEPSPAAGPVQDVAQVRIAPAAGEACPRYVAMVIEGVEVGPSPEWLVRRLDAIGVRPVNNIVDATNFVLWESGQPLHAFDFDRLAGDGVEVRFAKDGEELVTLDGECRRLDPEVLVIADSERPVAAAGVMGGEASEVTASTTRVFIESAHFTPAAVRRAAARLGLHTDASHRFERGADWQACRSSAERAAVLIQELAGGALRSGVLDVRAGEEFERLGGRLDLKRLDRFAGSRIPRERATQILTGLGFQVETEDADHLRVGVPSWRQYDFDRTMSSGEVWFADLAEEVLRHVGFDRVPADLPRVQGPDAPSTPAFGRRGVVRELMAACGYYEALSYAFYAASDATAYPSRVEGDAVELANPLSERYAVLRRSLLPALLESARYNLRRDAPGVRLFEIGHVFGGVDGDRVAEREVLGVVAAGRLGSVWDGREEMDLPALKGVLESLGDRLGAKIVARPADPAGFVAGTGAELFLESALATPIGVIGRLDLAPEEAAVYAAELELEALPAEPPETQIAVPPRHPGITMDLTLTHRDTLRWTELEQVIAAVRAPELERYGLKLRYRGEELPPETIATTIYFHYQAAERSLTQEEVNRLHRAMSSELEQRFGVERDEEESP